MQVEIDEVVATIRVRDGVGPRDLAADRHLIEAVLRAVEEREARGRRQDAATAIGDDGRGAIGRGDAS